MKLILTVAGALLILVGIVWFFQGIDVLPGSFMTGQLEWAFFGFVAVALGLGLLVLAKRRGNGPNEEPKP